MKQIVAASWVGIVGNGLLALLKVVAGLLARSAAVLSDGIDSGLDVLTSLITLVAARITDKPADLGHPYGHSRVETMASRVLALVIFLAGAQLAVSTVVGLVTGRDHLMPATWALAVTVVSIVSKSLLAFYKFRVGRRTSSPMLIADAKNMRSDIAISVAVLIGLLFTFTLDLPVLDAITALAVSLWIIYVAFRIFLETNIELMDGFTDRATYQRVFMAIEGVAGAENPHRTRIRTLGPYRIIDLDIEVNPTLTVSEAHRIAQQTERAIRAVVPNVYDVIVHVEPIGNVERSERYGVSVGQLDDDS